MTALARAGFTALAPDFRGFGLSDPPPEPDKATFSDLITDLLAILDALALSKVHNFLQLCFLKCFLSNFHGDN